MANLNYLLTKGLRGEHLVADLWRAVHNSALLLPDVINHRIFFTWMRNLLEYAWVNTKFSCHTPRTPIPYKLILALWPNGVQNINQLYEDNRRIASALMRNKPTLSDRQVRGAASSNHTHQFPSRDIDCELDGGVIPDSESVISAHAHNKDTRSQGAASSSHQFPDLHQRSIEYNIRNIEEDNKQFDKERTHNRRQALKLVFDFYHKNHQYQAHAMNTGVVCSTGRQVFGWGTDLTRPLCPLSEAEPARQVRQLYQKLKAGNCSCQELIARFQSRYHSDSKRARASRQ